MEKIIILKIVLKLNFFGHMMKMTKSTKVTLRTYWSSTLIVLALVVSKAHTPLTSLHFLSLKI